MVPPPVEVRQATGRRVGHLAVRRLDEAQVALRLDDALVAEIGAGEGQRGAYVAASLRDPPRRADAERVPEVARTPTAAVGICNNYIRLFCILVSCNITIDIFPSGSENAVRIELFGDEYFRQSSFCSLDK